jgi:phosphoribosylglycinamide formyltransferase-1
MKGSPAPIVVLISGRGSNLGAILDAIANGSLHARVCAVISNNPQAPGLARARAAGVATEVIDHRQYDSREAFDAALQHAIDRHQPHLVVLAGFMRILTRGFIEHFLGRLLNIHPSLLPKYPGLDTHRQALQAGEREHGATVHFVTPEVDSGPRIIQARVPVVAGDTPQILAERVLGEEHRIYPLAIQWVLSGRISLRDGQVLLDGAVKPEQGLTPPP